MEDGKQLAEWFRNTFETIRAQVARVVVGQEEVVENVLVAVCAGGHALLEGVPGLGKTLLVRTLAQTFNLQFSRIQFTPDLMPADITGTNILAESETGARTFVFRPGPVFANIVLADEINRATPKTQSALLEAMQEQAVTVAGKRYPLEPPFWVLATQNPIEQEGTYPLPEAQLDRFFFKILVGYPTLDELREIVNRTTGAETPQAESVADKETLLKMQRLVREVPIARPVQDFALKLIVATHPGSEYAPPEVNKYVRYGSSPRGAQTLILASKVYGLLDGRYNVAREDVERALKPALRHRVLLNFEAEADGITPDQLLETVLTHVKRTETEPIRV
ncbi:MAG: AAA family ATPase [Fimbriimonadales bacterium]|jgi:MoxR-like ATPase|nr:AAA family ATPase [Armatimonadota bacterium]MCX7688311.1 AAA family ATPase [Fimbriimonadales bacterium]CUU38148.1 MoxR-like ATPase [Armatimonadetes bacterium DC]